MRLLGTSRSDMGSFSTLGLRGYGQQYMLVLVLEREWCRLCRSTVLTCRIGMQTGTAPSLEEKYFQRQRLCLAEERDSFAERGVECSARPL